MWDGKRHLAPHTFPTKTMARAWLAQRRTSLVEGVNLPAAAEPHPAATRPLNAIFVSYLSSREAEGLSPATIRTYLSKWNVYIRPDLGCMSMANVDTSIIERWDRDTNWSSSHVRRNTHIVLKGFFKWCVDQHYIAASPMPRLGGVERSQRKRKCVVATPEQVAQIVEHMPPPLGIAVDLAAWCALRFGEVAALRRKDIDLDGGVVDVRASIKRGVGGHQTRGSVKTAAGNRTVAIPPKCLERVRRHFEEHVEPGPDALVVHMLGQSDKWLTNKSMHTYFDRACEAAGD